MPATFLSFSRLRCDLACNRCNIKMHLKISLNIPTINCTVITLAFSFTLRNFHIWIYRKHFAFWPLWPSFPLTWSIWPWTEFYWNWKLILRWNSPTVSPGTDWSELVLDFKIFLRPTGIDPWIHESKLAFAPRDEFRSLNFYLVAWIETQAHQSL